MANGQDAYRPEIIRALTAIHAHHRVNPATPSGQVIKHSPDDICTFPYGRCAVSFYMEIKTGKNGSLAFGTPDGGAGWRLGQIEFGKWLYSTPAKIPHFLAVMFDGLPKINRIDRRLYFVPFSVALESCRRIAPIQKTINWQLGKSSRLDLRTDNLCAENLWGEWQINRIVGGWDVKPIIERGLEHEWNHLEALNSAESDENKKPA